jgi:photosystem II stability/assembly factor-like uncharacterized protein
MRNILLAVLVLASIACTAQDRFPKVAEPTAEVPAWAQQMYAPDPDVRAVEMSYSAYFREHKFEKTVHTQYYKLWLNSVRGNVDASGHVRPKTAAQLQAREQQLKQFRETETGQDASRGGGGGWTWAGPEAHVADDGGGEEVAEQSNVYTIDRSLSNPDILYCGTESGGVYKSTDQAAHWSYVTKDQVIGAVSALRVHPTDPNTVLVSAEDELWRTIDGGTTWQIMGDAAFQALNISAWEFAFDPSDPQTVLAACNLGLYRSIDGGSNWTSVLSNSCTSIVNKTDDASVWYTVRYEPTLHYSRFYKSTDHGQTWSLRDSGWYMPPAGEVGDYQIEDCRLAVTAADAGRIYAVLTGYQQAGASVTTNGWIGTWVSTDAGETWSFPHGLIGTPYTAAHPNLMNFTGDDGTYTQIGYNTTVIASQIDPDRVLIGGLNLWRSDDGCATYQAVGGYIGPVARTHPDMQELRVYKTGPTSEEVWIGCDGGVYHSTDFVQSHESMCRGLRAVNLWGYDQGWNDDIRVGGRYHNGNMGYTEGYADDDYIALGGGEAPTGYVNYSDERKTYFSDVDGKVMPATLNESPVSFPMSFDPNESYYNCSSSRILFDIRYFNVAWSGKDNILCRSTNGGSGFNVFHTFGSNANDKVLWIEQSYADPKVFTVQQAVGNTSKLWRSVDDGATWAQLTLPSNSRDLYFAVGSEDPNDIWVGYTNRPNGQKAYHSTDGGATWNNITTPMLDNEQIWAIAHQYGTDGGVYLGLLNGRVLYRNNTMADWAEFSTGLPAGTEPLRIVPFYREGKVRLACWNIGVWEQDLFEPSNLQAGFSAAFGTFFCAGDSVHFVDHSVCGAGATYAWNFPGATPATSTEKYPTVTYAAPGQYDVSLTVSDNGQVSTASSTSFISETPGNTPPLAEGFESGAFPTDWIFHTSTGLPSGWSVGSDAGGYGNSTHSMQFDNYNNDISGARDEVWTGKMDLSQAIAPKLWFDVAYARWGGGYSDTLAVEVSTDCGATWTEVYLKGGETLATSPDFQEYFVPNATQWRTDTVALAGYAGEGEVIVAFQNRGHYGNVIRVDNINLVPDATIGIAENPLPMEMRTFPNPAREVLNISLSGAKPGPAELRVLDAVGREVLREQVKISGGTWWYALAVGKFAAGNYTLVVGAHVAKFNVLP